MKKLRRIFCDQFKSKFTTIEFDRLILLILFLGFGRGGRSPVMPVSPVRRPLSPDHPNPALPITDTPSSSIARMGWALRTLLVADNTSCLKDRKVRFVN